LDSHHNIALVAFIEALIRLHFQTLKFNINQQPVLFYCPAAPQVAVNAAPSPPDDDKRPPARVGRLLSQPACAIQQRVAAVAAADLIQQHFNRIA
jgi:hypothetical protein